MTFIEVDICHRIGPLGHSVLMQPMLPTSTLKICLFFNYKILIYLREKLENIKLIFQKFEQDKTSFGWVEWVKNWAQFCDAQQFACFKCKYILNQMRQKHEVFSNVLRILFSVQ